MTRTIVYDRKRKRFLSAEHKRILELEERIHTIEEKVSNIEEKLREILEILGRLGIGR